MSLSLSVSLSELPSLAETFPFHRQSSRLLSSHPPYHFFPRLPGRDLVGRRAEAIDLYTADGLLGIATRSGDAGEQIGEPSVGDTTADRLRAAIAAMLPDDPPVVVAEPGGRHAPIDLSSLSAYAALVTGGRCGFGRNVNAVVSEDTSQVRVHAVLGETIVCRFQSPCSE